MALKDKIINALDAAVKAVSFPVVTWDEEDQCEISTDRFGIPATILINEVSSNFGAPELNRRVSRLRERQDWQFQLIVEFSGLEVSLESLEEALSRGVVVPASAETGQPQVTVFLERVDYEHPPRENPQSGTRVTYIVQADLSPR